MQKDPAVKAFYLAHFNAAAKPDLTHWHDAKKKAVMLQALRAKFSCIPAMRAYCARTVPVLCRYTTRASSLAHFFLPYVLSTPEMGPFGSILGPIRITVERKAAPCLPKDPSLPLDNSKTHK